MKKIIMLIMLILTISLMFATIETEYNFDGVKYHSYSINIHNIENYSEQISNFSFSPLDEFCAERNMKSYIGRRISDTGCIDEFGNRYKYNVSYNNYS